jgi:tripartite ATP-independent transporter DctM subunit
VDIVAISVLIGSFLLLLIIGVPVAFSLGLSSVATVLLIGIPLEVVAQRMVAGVDIFVLMAVPFFILAGEIMGTGGIAQRLINLSNAIVGRFRGGMAQVNVLSSMFFGGISGSSVADTSAIGSVMIPMMKKKGYDTDYSVAVTITSSAQGVLLPPSHNMVIYSLVAGGVSISQLFMAGILPGILLGIALMIISYIIAVKRNYPKGEAVGFKDFLSTLFGSLLGLLTVLIVVVGVVVGFFTATESAAVATIYAFVITFFVFREIPFKTFKLILIRSLKTLAIVMSMIASASAFGWLMTFLRVPDLITNALLSVSDNVIIVLLMLNIAMLCLGMIMDMGPLILVLTPILIPVAEYFSIDPVHLGIIMMLNLSIGLISPPVGNTLYLGAAIGKIPVHKTFRVLMPFYLTMLIVLAIVTYFPQFVLFLPDLIAR